MIETIDGVRRERGALDRQKVKAREGREGRKEEGQIGSATPWPPRARGWREGKLERQKRKGSEVANKGDPSPGS